MQKTLLALIFLGLIIARSDAQVLIPGSFDNDYYQLLRIKNPHINHLSYWTSIDPIQDTLSWNLWDYFDQEINRENGLYVNNPSTGLSFNSTYARSYNDGPLWKGKGLTWEGHAGMSFRSNKFSFTFHPTIYFSQNADFELAPRIKDDVSGYSYQFSNKFAVSYRVDWVQRYGNQAFMRFHPGQSEIRYADRFFSVGVGTQNVQMGPSVISPIIMSRNGAGFPMVDIGTSKPQNLRIKDTNLGKFETKLLYGLMSESQHFDTIPDNTTRYFTGLSVGYSFPFLPNLSIGLNKILYKNTNYFDPTDLVAVFYRYDNGVYVDSVKTNDTFDQMASLFADWYFPEADLRTYIEWARNDFNGGIKRLLTSIEHSRAYTIGLQKSFDLAKNRYLLFSVEHTNLVRSNSWMFRPNPPYYQHIFVDHGYTHDGQILGAGTGGGSRVEYVSLAYFTSKSMLSADLQMIRFDDDYFLEHVQGYNDPEQYQRQDNEYSIGLKYQYNFDRLTLSTAWTNSFRLNQYYIQKNDKYNAYLHAGVKFLIN